MPVIIHDKKALKLFLGNWPKPARWGKEKQEKEYELSGWFRNYGLTEIQARIPPAS